MKSIIRYIFLLLFIIPMRLFAQTNAIDYFGQTPPGDSAVVFAPGIISLPDRLQGKISFSHDGKEFYFTVWGTKFSSCKIYYTKRVNNTWTEQVEAPFSIGHFCGEPSFSIDGNKLYFDYTPKGILPNILMVQRTPQGWSDPQELPSPINSDHWDACYLEVSDSIAYFTSNRPGGFDDKGDLYRVRRLSGQPVQADKLDTTVNSTSWDACPCVAPDESYLIFTSERPGGHGNSDLYIVFKKQDGGWTEPVNMERNGSGININNKYTNETDPSLSPDGRFLFFSRHTSTATSEQENVYWVSTKIIDDIKKEVFKPRITK